MKTTTTPKNKLNSVTVVTRVMKMDRVRGEATTSATVFQYALYLLSKGTVAMEGELRNCSNPTRFTLFSFCVPRRPYTARIGLANKTHYGLSG